MIYVILDRFLFMKPMVQLAYDGNKMVPAPGTLFICRPEDSPTLFDNKRLATAAVKRSVKWRGEPDESRYLIIDVPSWEAMNQPRVRGKKKGKRKNAKAHGGPADGRVQDTGRPQQGAE